MVPALPARILRDFPRMCILQCMPHRSRDIFDHGEDRIGLGSGLSDRRQAQRSRGRHGCGAGDKRASGQCGFTSSPCVGGKPPQAKAGSRADSWYFWNRSSAARPAVGGKSRGVAYNGASGRSNHPAFCEGPQGCQMGGLCIGHRLDIGRRMAAIRLKLLECV
jgi:hypothetical protein